ncbi:MAG: hypothetical protein QG604_773 [Candidatus Dependentiae bacterium]|nr:hypothetical protein [Candidatus Dependentiae bacterium]
MIHLSEYIAWIPMILFCGAPLAQVYLNWCKQSTKSLSQWTVFLGISGLMCSLLYDHFMCLPFAYRVMHPLILLAWTMLALQEFWYSGRKSVSKEIAYSYAAVVTIALAVLFWGGMYPLEVGFSTGWLFTILYAIFQLPQLIKNQREKSVEGLSIWYVVMLGSAACAELGIAYWRLLPIQSVLNAVRGLLVYTIFIYQFASFSKKKRAS